jgi:hypothetical protein
MIDLEGVSHHPAITEIVDVLCNKTQNTDRSFFQVEAAFFLAKMASSMRATISTKDRGEIPVNIYALALATSGYGKGHSISIIENEFLKGFQKRFMDDTFNVLSEQNLNRIANDRAARLGSDQQEELERVEKEFKSAGAYPFTFDSGTSPAVKQLRHKLLLAGNGAINLQIDEIGSNLINNTEVLTLFLELFDQGMVKQKLVKNTADNQRGDDMDGKTPANMLLFGTPSKLLDGGMNEEHFYSFLDIGYARRCIFGHGQQHKRAYETMDAAEIYQKLIQPTNNQAINKWFAKFHRLADPAMYGWKMKVEDSVGIKLLEYKIACEKAADLLKEHEEIRKAELSHRYFKALKLAGAFAFVDESNEVELEHLMSAILLVEESGKAFQNILNREKSYVKLARYIADIATPVTHADLHEALPFYARGNAARNEMMTLATAWGYKRHIIIRKTFTDGIEFYEGEKLQETNLDEIVISYSEHWAYNYIGEKVPFDQLHVVTQAPGYHWCNHHFKNQHRAEENVHAGFNLISIDVDGGVSLAAVHELLKDYKFLTYTTKRHTEEENRFRLILPTNYHMVLDSEDYREFMNSVMEWLPFKTDESANQRAKKWESFAGGSYHYNDGELLDVLDFIPKTSRNEAYKNQNKELQSLDNLERWFAQRIAMGNRNNHMIKFALALVDSGLTLIEVNRAVHEFNKKLSNPMSEDEIDKTIMVTVGKRYTISG